MGATPHHFAHASKARLRAFLRRHRLEARLLLRFLLPALLLVLCFVFAFWGGDPGPEPSPGEGGDSGEVRRGDRRPECLRELPHPWRATLPLAFPGSDRARTRIPKIVHFIFGLRHEGQPTFSFVNFAAVCSALAVLRPEKVMMHLGREPVGFLWELVKPHVELAHARVFDTVFGNPIENYAHMADVIRLEVLLEYGGIYLDADVVTLRPFDTLLDSLTVMGMEGQDGRVGLCNAAMAAVPNAPFLRKWYDAYRSFNHSQWNYHSVLLPKKLASEEPSSIRQLTYKAFHWPLWDEEGIELMMNSYDYNYSENFAVHMWSHGVSRSRFSKFSMPWCFECHSTLVSMLKAYVPDPLISVVMPCYNQADYIREAMMSVASQSFPSWELIVVDDLSPDHCGARAELIALSEDFGAQGRRVRVIRNTKNKGLAESRNVGIRAAKGLWICALDADDKIRPEYFERAAEAMSLDPGLQVITSDQQFFGNSTWLWTLPPFDTATVMSQGPLPVMSLYLRRLWADWGGYSAALPWGNEDYDFWLRLLEVGVSTLKLPGALTMYRYKEKSMMRDAEDETSTEIAMLRTRHPSVFHPAKLMREHTKIMQMSNRTRKRLELLVAREDARDDDRACQEMWLSMGDLSVGDFGMASSRALRAQRFATLSWQPSLYFALAVCGSDGAAVAGPLLSDIAAKYPSLGKTEAFARHLANCQASSTWRASPRRRDSVAWPPPKAGARDSLEPTMPRDVGQNARQVP